MQWKLVEQAAPVALAAPSVTLSAAKDDRPIWEIFAESIKDLPANVVATLPADGASQQST